jgi:hypothetical protein
VVVLAQDRVESRAILRCQAGRRAAQQTRFQQGTQLKQLLDLVEGGLRHDGAAMGQDLDEPFALELNERLAKGNPADAEFARKGVLAELVPARINAAENPLAQRIGRG